MAWAGNLPALRLGMPVRCELRPGPDANIPMLSIEQHAEQRRTSLRCRLHLSGGIWWEQKQPFYAKPAFEFQSFAPGAARPDRTMGFLVYSHQVPNPAMSNRLVDWMILQGDDLDQFSLARLRSEKRNQVRKGLKNCDVRLIPDIEPHLEQALQINAAQAERHAATGWFTRSPAYFARHAQAWRAETRRYFSLPGWQWWGAFAQGQLVAYMRTLQVADVMFIVSMKNHTELLKLGGSDAIYFTALEAASRSGTVARIVNGGPMRPSLDRFKEQFLFRRTSTPYFLAGASLLRLGKRLFQLKERLRIDWQQLLARPTQRLGGRPFLSTLAQCARTGGQECPCPKTTLPGGSEKCRCAIPQ